MLVKVDRYMNRAEEQYTTYAGLSTDTKPVDSSIENGDEFEEIDTGYVYRFNGETREWVKQKK